MDRDGERAGGGKREETEKPSSVAKIVEHGLVDNWE
jgi:hypothetical protein